MTELSGYVLVETLREGGEFTLNRGCQHGNPLPVLVLTPVAEQPTPASLRTSRHLCLRSSRNSSRRPYEERYQAAVESDLRRCLAEWELKRRIGEFPLCEHDTPDRLH